MKHFLSISILVFLTTTACKEKGHEHHAMQPGMAARGSIFQLTSSWVNAAEKTVSLNSLQGKPVAMAMVYLSCKFVCPRITADLKYIQKKLGDKKDKAQFILVTIDPERDTIQNFLAYREKHGLDSGFGFLKGSPSDIRELAAVLGFKYKQLPNGEFAHSNMVHILDDKGNIVYQQNGISSDLDKTVAALQEVLQGA